MSWLDDFKREDGDGPPDGEHTAFLEHAVLRDTKNGKAIKLEWRTTDLEFYWESWHNTTGGGKPRTQQLLDALEVDLSTIRSEDQLADELAAREGPAYIVKVSRSADGRFVNTAVVEKPETVQATLSGKQTTYTSTASDIPADTSGLPEAETAPPVAQAASSAVSTDLFDDDDVPF